jgi:uncharacterized membrane protein
VLAAAYAWYFARLSVAVQDGYGTFGFDMGIFDQGVWLLSRLHAPFVTVMGRDLFGDHTSFILLLAVPLYWVHDAPQTLLVLQPVLLAGAAVPIYAVARRLLGRDGVATALATLLAGAYLCNPALQQGDLEQFHPEAFLTFTVALALYAAIEGRRRLLWLSVLASVLVKEDTAALMVPLGLWVAWRRDRRTGLGIAALAIAYTLFAYQVVIATLLGTTSFYAGRVPFGGLGGLLATLTRHPGRVAAYLSSAGRPFYLWQLGCSTGWMWVVSPEVAAVGIGTFTENTISTFGYMHQILYHYTLPLVPVLAMGTVWAVGRLGSRRRRAAATGVATLAAVVCCGLWGLAPWSVDTYPHLDPSSVAVAEINAVRAAIPPDADIAAYFSYLPHVDHRTHCYQWPTPFQAENWGLGREAGRRLAFAGAVHYLFLPTRLDAGDEAVLDQIRDQFRVVRTNPQATLWERTRPAQRSAAGVVRVEKPFANGVHDRLHPGVQVQLLQDVAHVVLHGVLRDVQLLGHLLVAHPCGHQLEHLELPAREHRRRELLLLGSALGQRVELLQQLGGHPR